MEKNIIEVEIRYLATDDLSQTKFNNWIEWWSIETKKNPHVLSLEPPEIRNNMVFSVFALLGSHIIGAAGLMHIPHHKHVFFKRRPVLEFRANCVLEPLQDLGIGTTLHQLRIDYVDENKFQSIMITKQQKMLHISKKFNWKHISRIKGTQHVVAKARDCLCQSDKTKVFVGPRCETCPLYQRDMFLREYSKL